MIIQTGLEPNQPSTDPSHNNSECLNQTEFEPNLYTHATVLELNLSNLQLVVLLVNFSILIPV